jgi:pseudouridine-5'-phosphate glycosidase
VSQFLQVSAEVAEALARGRPVVALETSIVGQGLPAPHNLEAAFGCEAAIREEGAVPATIGVLDGSVKIGLTRSDVERIAAGSEKVSSRDLGPALVRQKAGATTVAATMRAAAMAGIRFMAGSAACTAAIPRISPLTCRSSRPPRSRCSARDRRSSSTSA